MKTKLSLYFGILLLMNGCLFSDDEANNTSKNNTTNNNTTAGTNNATTSGTNNATTSGTNNATTSGNNNTTVAPRCGDDLVNQPEEECDGTGFTEVCTDITNDDGLAFTDGLLACRSSCEFNTDACSLCGDGDITGNEVCEESVACLGGRGEVTCAPDCLSQDFSACDPFVELSTGGDHTCGLTALNKIVCWGDNISGALNSPLGDYKAITSGRGHSCAIKLDDTVVCWGEGFSGQTDMTSFNSNGPTPITTTFKSISAGSSHTCGVKKVDGKLACWGQVGAADFLGEGKGFENDVFTKVSSGVQHTCGLRTDKKIVCWGNDSAQENVPTADFNNVEVGFYQSCGLTDLTGNILCWGGNDGLDGRPSGVYDAIGLGTNFGCGLGANKKITCWTGNANSPGNDDRVKAPMGDFKKITVGTDHGCGIQSDDEVICWGNDQSGETVPPTPSMP